MDESKQVDALSVGIGSVNFFFEISTNYTLV
jgi:hypothetical protein